MRYLNISPSIFKFPGIDIKSLLLNKLKTLCNKIWKEELFNDRRNNTGGGGGINLEHIDLSSIFFI